jgi:hypothetical protein
MDLFQQIVATTALVFLIIFLIYIAFAMRHNKLKLAFPPVTANCPDYWVDQSDGDSSNCINVQNLGISSESCPKNMNFSTSLFSTVCAKSVWAKNCGLTWDGVTNNDTPCTN